MSYKKMMKWNKKHPKGLRIRFLGHPFSAKEERELQEKRNRMNQTSNTKENEK